MHNVEALTGVGIHILQLSHHLHQQSVSARLSHIQHIVAEALCRLVASLVVEVEAAIVISLLLIGVDVFLIAITHRHNGCTRMSRSLYFGYDFHAALVGILQHLHKLASGDVAVGWCLAVVGVTATGIGLHHKSSLVIVERMAFAGTYLGEFGQPWNFQTPRLVVAEMQLKHIHLVFCQAVDEVEQIGIRNEISAYVEHHATIMEIGIVNHAGAADLLAIHKFKHRCEGFHAIEHALCRLSGNGNTLLAHFEHIRLAILAHGRLDAKRNLELGFCHIAHTEALQLAHQIILCVGQIRRLAHHSHLGGHVNAFTLGIKCHLFWHRHHGIFAHVAVKIALGVRQRVLPIHIIAVGIVFETAHAELFILFKRSHFNLHRQRLAARLCHKVHTIGLIADVAEITAAHHLHGDFLTRSKRLVTVVRAQANVIIVHHWLQIQRLPFCHLNVVRKLVVVERPAVAKRFATSILDGEIGRKRAATVLAHLPPHTHRALLCPHSNRNQCHCCQSQNSFSFHIGFL